MRSTLALVPFLCASLAVAQTSPATPVVTEPSAVVPVLNPQDVHMETAPFSDADGDGHLATDWEIWTFGVPVRVWSAHGVTGPEKIHAHFGDGVFEGPQAGATQLANSTSYQLRVRHRDDSGDPATEWSAWALKFFVTGSATQVFSLDVDDVSDTPEPRWFHGSNIPVDLPDPASLRVEAGGQLLLQVDGDPAPGNVLTNPAGIPNHHPVRLVVEAGTAPLVVPESTLQFTEHAGCEVITVLLPAINLTAGQTVYLWVSAAGATYIGGAMQTTPNFGVPARNFMLPWRATQDGFQVELVASGFQLPVNIAFVPNPGPAPDDPKFYVTELYGSIKVVTNDGTVSNYAGSLIDFTPTGAFPGSGEQGLTGLAVDPVTGDVFASVLRDEPGPGTNHEPRIVRFTSTDGGRTAASETTILYMPGEYQGQSHQISRLEIVGGELYCHMGDGFDASTARSLGSFRGKILRLNLDGSPVVTNPWYNPTVITARDYVYARGVRNPFGGAWRELDGARYMVENGPSRDRFAKIVSGRDYLWAGSDNDMNQFALHVWNPASGPVNLAWVQPGTFGGSGFPAHKMDRAFVSESGATYAQGQQAVGKRITEWELDAAGNLVNGGVPFVEYIGDGRATVAGLAAGPDGLYFTELYRDLNTSGPTDSGARVVRVRFGTAEDCNDNSHPDWCDIATAASTDFNHNDVPDECEMLAEDGDEIALSMGGSVTFTLDAGTANAGKTYWLLGSSTGTTPGTSIQNGNVLPLNAINDPWFRLTMLNPNTPVLATTLGTLDANGRATAQLTLPAGTPSILAGWTLDHAFVLYDPVQRFFAASNSVPMTLAP